jgi:hypothetical protein
MRYQIRQLPNGLIELFDRRCLWTVVYRPDGRYVGGGGPSSEEYRAAVMQWVGPVDLITKMERDYRRKIGVLP